MSVTVGADPYLRACALSVRLAVFVQERHLSMIAEFDDGDEPGTVYAVAFADFETPVATGRFALLDARTMRPGRIATLGHWRGCGLGAQILTALEAHGQTLGCTRSVIHSEQTAQGFYESQGYRVNGPAYLEDGVACVTMTKTL